MWISHHLKQTFYCSICGGRESGRHYIFYSNQGGGGRNFSFFIKRENIVNLKVRINLIFRTLTKNTKWYSFKVKELKPLNLLSKVTHQSLTKQRQPKTYPLRSSTFNSILRLIEIVNQVTFGISRNETLITSPER